MADTLFTAGAFVIGTLFGGGCIAALSGVRRHDRQAMADMFKALASDTLHQNTDSFLRLASERLKQSEQAAAATLTLKSSAIDEMVKPVRETLKTMNEQLQAIEVKREGAYRELAQMVADSREAHLQLRHETGQLLQALRAPTARGRWGEMQLQRILEMTGMSAHARDFRTQETVSGDDGVLRPDMVVALPGDRCVVIDSKVPLAAYLDAVQAPDEASRAQILKQHARHVRDHIKRLGAKTYWKQVDGAPEFVVLFLPGEHFLGAALDGDADLMEFSASQQVVLATPMTLIALLRAVAMGWQQESLRDNVRRVADLGRALHASLQTFVGHVDTLGTRLGSAVESYNKTVGSLERNVLSKARQLSDFGAAGIEGELQEPAPLERQPRQITTDKPDSSEAA